MNQQHFKRHHKPPPPNWVKFVNAMENAMKALLKNGTWVLTDLPKDKKTVRSKWIYKIKYQLNGEIERYKARLIAKGFV